MKKIFLILCLSSFLQATNEFQKLSTAIENNNFDEVLTLCKKINIEDIELNAEQRQQIKERCNQAIKDKSQNAEIFSAGDLWIMCSNSAIFGMSSLLMAYFVIALPMGIITKNKEDLVMGTVGCALNFITWKSLRKIFKKYYYFHDNKIKYLSALAIKSYVQENLMEVNGEKNNIKLHR